MEVAVAVHQQHLTIEAFRFGQQLHEEFVIAPARPPGAEILDVRVGLHDYHDAFEPERPGPREGGGDPGFDGCTALHELLARRAALAKIIVAARYVEGKEQQRADLPALVFGPARKGRIVGLGFDGQRVAAQGLPRLGEEQLAQSVQPFERVVGAVAAPVAVGPVVVTGNEHKGMLAGLEHRQALVEERVVAALAATFEIAVVDHHLQRLGVHFGDERRQVATLEAVVGRVAEDAEAERLRRLGRDSYEGQNGRGADDDVFKH